ncbi:hypothetical protein K525DRAFT_366326 [Schizophyllum commune Loenen D]|nr:hypothetical protein K525DRAFT_366326 [Schizophyllum commune Loenen D]
MFSYENLLEAGLRTVSFTAAGLGLTTAGLGAVAYQQWDEVTGLITDGFASFLGTPGSSDETRASTATSHDEIEGAGNVAANVNEAAHPEPAGKLGAVASETSAPVLASASPFVTTENTTIESVSSDSSTDDSPTSFPLDDSAQLPSTSEPDIARKMVEISATVFLLFVIFGTWFIRRKRLSFALSLAAPSVDSKTAATNNVQEVLSDIEEEVDAKHALEAPNVNSEEERADAPEDASKATPHVTVADEDPEPDVPVDEAVNIRDDEAVPAQPDDAPAPRTEVVPAAQRTEDVPIAQRMEVVSVAPREVDVPVAPRAEDIPVAQTIDGHAPNPAVPIASAPPKPALPPAIPLPQGAAVPLPQEAAPVPPPQAAFDPPQQDEPDPPHAPATPPVPASPLAPASPTAPASQPAPARLRPPTPELQAPAPQAREAQEIQAREAGQEREEREAANEQEAEQAREAEQATVPAQLALQAQAAPQQDIDAIAQRQAQADDPVRADVPAPEDVPVPAARGQAEVEQPDEARIVPKDAAHEVRGAVVRDGRDAMERNSPEPDDAREVDNQPEAPEVDAVVDDADDDGEGAPDVDEGASDDDEGAPEVDEGAPDVGDGAHDAGDGDGAVDDGAAEPDVHVGDREEVHDEHDAEARGEDDAEGHDVDDADAQDAAANVGDGEGVPDDDAAVNDEDGDAVGDVDGVMRDEGAVAREDEPVVAVNDVRANVHMGHGNRDDDNAAQREGGAAARQGVGVDVNPAGEGEIEDAEPEADDEAQDIANAAAAAVPIEAPQLAPMQEAAPLPAEGRAPAPVEAVDHAPVHVDDPAPDAAANPAPDAAAIPVPEQPEAAAVPVPEPAPAPPLVQPRRPLIWQPRARPVDPPVPAPTPFEQEHPAPFERSGLTKRTPTMPAYDPEQVEPNPHLEGFDDSEPEDVDDQRLAMWPVYGPAMKPVDDPLPEAANVGREGAEVRDGPAVVGAVVGEAAIENAGDSAEALGDLGADVEGEDAQVDAAPVPAHVGSQDQSKHALSPRPAEPAAYASTSAAAIKMDDGAFMKRDDDFPIASGSALPAVATSSTASPGPSSSSASCSNTVPAGAKVIELQGGPSKVDRKGKGRAVAPQEDEDRPSSLDDKPTEPPRRTDDAPFAAIDVGRLANITETDDSFDTETGSARQSLVSAVGGLAQTRGRARERAGPAPSDARQGRRASMQLSRNAQRASSSRRTKSADVQENKRPISARLRDGRTADSKSTQPRRVNSPNPTTGAGSAINVRGSRIATRSSSLNKQRPGKVDEQR